MRKLIYILFLVFGCQNNSIAEDKNLYKADWDFMFNPNSFKQDFSKYDQLTSTICCQLSYLAYYSPSDIKYAEAEFNKYFPNTIIKIKYLDEKDTGTELIFFGTKNFVIVAFRGTEISKIKDLVTDAKYFSYRTKKVFRDNWKNIPPGHGGFRTAIKKTCDAGILDSLNIFMTELGINDADKQSIPIYTTGHSLGAGLAVMFIEPLKYEPYHFNYSGTYAFCPPLMISSLVQDKAEVDQFKKENAKLIHNIVHYRDYVTRAGKNHKSVLEHVGHYYRICLNQDIVKNNSLAIRFDKARRFKVLKYHTITNVLRYIQYAKNDNVLLEKRTEAECLCDEDTNQKYSKKLVPIESVAPID